MGDGALVDLVLGLADQNSILAEVRKGPNVDQEVGR